MERTHNQTSDLERIAANQLEALLEQVAVGSTLSVDSSSDLCDTLELLIPEILRRDHREWEKESIDGFFFSSAIKTDERSCELAGTCILISDQTVTPFALTLGLGETDMFRSFRVRLGEPGRGPLGISGPACNSRAAQEMLFALNERLDQVDWVYAAAL
jgi:hypothetical protein